MLHSDLSNGTQMYRRLILIIFTTTAVISSVYAFFLLQHILIVYPPGHLLPVAVAAEISFLIPMWMVLIWKYIQGEKTILPIAGIIIILWLIPQITFIACIEYDYRTIESEYEIFTLGELRTGDDPYAASWNVSLKYLHTFSSSGNDIRNPVPLRSIYPENQVFGYHILLHHYLFRMDGFEKLTVVDRRGNCSEFARAVSFLINRTLQIPSRLVILYGYDHKFAEVKIGKDWLIVDPLKTTPKKPVWAAEYADYLNSSHPSVYNQITGISSADRQSLLSGHGFKEA